jgi:hypothetical protein
MGLEPMTYGLKVPPQREGALRLSFKYLFFPGFPSGLPFDQIRIGISKRDTLRDTCPIVAPSS